MGKLSRYSRERIVALYYTGTQVTKIMRTLNQEGIQTSRSAVSLFLSRYRRTGSILDAPRSGRKQILSEEDVDFIDQKMHENDELTSSELKDILVNERGVQISTQTIRRIRRDKLGWKSETTRYCQFVREPNKIRVTFCLDALVRKDAFQDVIFTDETSVQIEQHTRISFHKDGTQLKRKGRPKHPLKVSYSSSVPITTTNYQPDLNTSSPFYHLS